jgi:hypothetical protein
MTTGMTVRSNQIHDRCSHIFVNPVRSWITHGELRVIDVGREWRIAPGDLESFLKRHANRSPDDTDRREGEPDGGGTPFRSPAETSPKQEE